MGKWYKLKKNNYHYITTFVLTSMLMVSPAWQKAVAESMAMENMMMDNAMMMSGTHAGDQDVVSFSNPLDAINSQEIWLNSKPITAESLKGKVVLIDFWTYSCINCLRTLPYVKNWAEKYKDDGLVVIGVHAPEFSFEKDTENVTKAVKDLGVEHPVVIDNDFTIWKAFKNRYWPAHYFINTEGEIAYYHFGEGEYERSEQVIRDLLEEAGKKPHALQAKVVAEGVHAAADMQKVKSHETYIGYSRAKNFVGQQIPDEKYTYKMPNELEINQWALGGDWTITHESAIANSEGSKITYKFHARDLHLVLASKGGEIPFTVRIDGKAPGADHGMDIDAQGNGVVTEERLYQLIRQKGDVTEHTFEIEFHKPDVEVFAFTFG